VLDNLDGFPVKIYAIWSIGEEVARVIDQEAQKSYRTTVHHPVSTHDNTTLRVDGVNSWELVRAVPHARTAEEGRDEDRCARARG